MALRAELKPSRLLLAWLLVLHLLSATVCLLYLPVAQIPALLLLSVSLGFSIYRSVLLKGADSVTRIEFQDGAWRIGGSEWLIGVELRAATVWPWLIALQLRQPGRRCRRHVLILRDMLGADAFTQLKVAARFAPLSP